MEVLDIGIERLDILPPNIGMPMVSMTIKVLECLHMKKDVGIGILRPSTLTFAIM